MQHLPPTGPRDGGLLDVGDGHRIHWEAVGAPGGRPAVVLHGGPGSGCTAAWARFFDLERYRVVLFDQRGCGGSVPSAASDLGALSSNTTRDLIADIERLRRRAGVESWLVLGGSWGSTLALAYAQAHPSSVSGLVLFSVATTTRREIEWITRGLGRFFPREWERFRDGVPAGERDGSLAEAYHGLLVDPDPDVHSRAAIEWCAWEDRVARARPHDPPDPRFEDPAFRLCFARLVTHYWRHGAWLEEDALLRDAPLLAAIPGVLVHGRLDLGSPLDIPYRLSRAWPGCELRPADGEGHGAGTEITAALREATDRFAVRAEGGDIAGSPR